MELCIPSALNERSNSYLSAVFCHSLDTNSNNPGMKAGHVLALNGGKEVIFTPLSIFIRTHVSFQLNFATWLLKCNNYAVYLFYAMVWQKHEWR
jgi:hypothetical protein